MIGQDRDNSAPWAIPRRLFTMLMGAFTLQACGGGGGGGTSAAQVVGVYGNSMDTGDYLLPDGVTWSKLPRPSITQLRALLPAVEFIDYSLGAATAAEALGLPNVWGLPVGRLPFGPFETHIRTARETTVLLRYGVADESGGERPADFDSYLDRLVVAALGAGKRVIVVGTEATWPAFGSIVHAVAIRRGVQYVDISGVPVVLIDAVHADQATSDATTALIASAIQANQG